MSTYTFTDRQLIRMLSETIGAFLAYRDVHGKNKTDARFAAVDEILQGLEADRELDAQDDKLQSEPQQ